MTNADIEKMHKLWSEYHFRVATIRRLYPTVRFRHCSGGPPWDHTNGEYVLAIIPDVDDHHGVYFEETLTTIMREVHKLQKPDLDEHFRQNPVDPESLPMKMRQVMMAFTALATTEETWTEAVQANWKRWSTG